MNKAILSIFPTGVKYRANGAILTESSARIAWELWQENELLMAKKECHRPGQGVSHDRDEWLVSNEWAPKFRQCQVETSNYYLPV